METPEPAPARRNSPRPPGDTAELLDGLAAAPGEEFLRWCVGHLARTLDCEWVVVWERSGDAWENVRSVAASRRGAPFLETITFPLAGTPCEVVYRKSVGVYPQAVQQQFPALEVLKRMDAESYVGIALSDEVGRPLGHLTLVDVRPIADPAPYLAALESLRSRVLAELVARYAVAELRTVIDAGSRATSRETFQALARALAWLFHVKIGFVCELVPEKKGYARALACCVAGEQREPFEFSLEGTPCARIYEELLVCHPSRLQQSFPDDGSLKELGAESCLGTALRDASGRVLGHVGVMHDQPLDARLAQLPLFQLVAARAATELARRRDEEEKLRVERQLFEAQKMESLGVLAGGIAHDFNNLLMGILGNASLALVESGDLSPVRSYLKEIELSARRAADLARQMLAYSGRGHFVVEPLNLSVMVEEISHLLQVMVPKKVVLRYQLQKGLPAVKGDATQLRQVIMNLVLNGAEAIGVDSGQSGIVSISTGLVRVDASYLAGTVIGTLLDPGDYVFLETTDTGCGMDAAMRARIFEPFFTTKATGRGLGLSAVQGIVRGHKGALKVYSEPERGTTFKLLLPVCDELVETRAEREDRAPEWTSHGLVLIVDDEETVRAATARMLEKVGFRVRLAEDGRAGVLALKDVRDDVRFVLLDMAMPYLSGEEAYREMRLLKGDLRVILMSGYNEQEATRRFHGKGLAGFLQKPFSFEDLRRKVRTVLEGP